MAPGLEDQVWPSRQQQPQPQLVWRSAAAVGHPQEWMLAHCQAWLEEECLELQRVGFLGPVLVSFAQQGPWPQLHLASTQRVVVGPAELRTQQVCQTARSACYRREVAVVVVGLERGFDFWSQSALVVDLGFAGQVDR